VTVTVVALALAALDIFDGSVHRWWAEHAFTTALVAGILVLLMTVLIADRVIHHRQLRDRSRAIAAQAAIVMTQATRTAQSAAAMLDGTGDTPRHRRGYGPGSAEHGRRADASGLASAAGDPQPGTARRGDRGSGGGRRARRGRVDGQLELDAAAGAGGAMTRREKARARCPTFGA
jgi:hypothetical protein